MSKVTNRPQKISPSKGNSRSPHTPSPSKTAQTQGHSVKGGSSSTPPGRGSGHMARRELGLSSSSPSLSSSSCLPRGPSSPSVSGEDASLLWVDKYRPFSLKAVLGQQGDQSCANKLLRWLKNWYKNNGSTTSKAPGTRLWGLVPL